MNSLVNEIKEKIEILGLNDKDGWRETAGLLEEVMGLPDARDTPFCADIIGACHDAFMSIVEGRATDLLHLVASVSEALDVLNEVFEDGSKDQEMLREACERLRDLTDPGTGQEVSVLPPENDGSSDEKTFSSLHEAGAFFIQLELGDREGIARLEAGLKSLLETVSSPVEGKEFVHQALETLQAILESEDADADALLREVGSLLEEAMSQEEQLLRTHEPSSETGAPLEQVKTKEYRAPLDLDPDLVNEFVQEGSDLLAKAEVALLSLETDPEDMEAVGTIFRAFHTVKGTSAFLGLELVSNLGHYAESLLSRVRDGEIRYGGIYADLSLRALDMLRGIIDQVQTCLPGELMEKPAGYDSLVFDLEHPDEAAEGREGDDSVLPTRVGDILVARGDVSREKVERAALLPGSEPIGTKILKTKAATVGPVAKALRAQKSIDRTYQTAASVRVDTERLDRLVDLVGEMVIAHSMIAQDFTVTNGKNQDLARKVGDTTKIVRQLQDISMSLRMVPLRGVFQKMARLVRDLSRKISKQVTLVTEGEDTEIDRNMVDIINDPLVHMIRNAVDHGIELPHERAALGKPETGTIRLSAYHSAGNVVVEINDDGKGLDKEKILAKAKARGLIPEGAAPGDREIFNFIFAPGFSTAETVTDVSGRGVGMDVVRKNIESIRGQMDIQSQPGVGSTFRMALPLTLAIIDGMVVRVGAERYILPTGSIVRSVKPAADDVGTVLEQGEMVQLQGELIPIFRLSKLFEVSGAETDITDGIVTVIENDGKQVALLVDELVGRQQIVIKSLGETLRKVQGIAGGAVMPDGRIGLILDVGGLVRLAVNH